MSFGLIVCACVCFLLPSAENLKILIECPVRKKSIVELLTSEDPAVQRACLALLRVYSEMPYGRRLAMDTLSVHTWDFILLFYFFYTMKQKKCWIWRISLLSIWSVYNILAQKLQRYCNTFLKVLVSFCSLCPPTPPLCLLCSLELAVKINEEPHGVLHIGAAAAAAASTAGGRRSHGFG